MKIFDAKLTGSIEIQSPIPGVSPLTASWANNIVGGAGQAFPYTGSAIISGSLIVTGAVSFNDGFLTQTITASFISASSGITGSLFGTASWAQNAVTSSYILQAVSSSFASTASFVQLAQTASSVGILNQNVIITGSLIVSGSSGSGVFSKGVTLADLANTFTVTGSYFVWRAPYPATVVGLWAIKSGSGTTSINARRSGSGASTHLSSNLVITTDNLWSSGSGIQNTSYSIGDSLEIIFSGSSIFQSSVQVDFIKR